MLIAKTISKLKKGLKNLSFDIAVSVSTFAGRGRAPFFKNNFKGRSASMKNKKINSVYKGYYSNLTLSDIEVVYTKRKKERRKFKIKYLVKFFFYVLGEIGGYVIHLILSMLH